MMRRLLSIIVSVVIWAAIIAYMVWSSRLSAEKRSGIFIQSMDIIVADSSSIDILRPENIKLAIINAGYDPVGKHIDSVNTRRISEAVLENGFVRSAKTYAGLEGNLTVSVTQREPIMRVITDEGYNFYYTIDGYILPIQDNYPRYVPVVTGNFGLPFDKSFAGNLESMIAEEEKKSDKNYIFLRKLINFVEYTGNNSFWNSQIVQINVISPAGSGSGHSFIGPKEPDIELIPRVGDHVIMLGKLDGYKQRLDKLFAFYNGVLDKEGWTQWNHINLKYEGQVVCSNGN